MPFQVLISFHSLVRLISQAWSASQPMKAFTDMLPSKGKKKELQEFLGIINYLGIFFFRMVERSSYLTIFTCQFGRYSYTLKEDMFQHQIDRIFKNYPMYLALQMTY